MDRDPEDKQAMSLRLSRVLRDIGVTKQMVVWRRRTFLIKEKMDTVLFNIRYHQSDKKYYFGSQSEGTTTLGMNSDVDLLTCINDFCVIMDLAEWEPGKNCLLMIKNEHSPPQHCCLQMIRSDRPLPHTLYINGINLEMNGRMLLKNTWLDSGFKQGFSRYFIKQGPSRTAIKELDIVHALYCNTTLSECQTLFTRPKPGHWPRPVILTMARQYGIFLVPQGYPESDQSHLEWRISTSLIERLLMFDLCIVKIQVYTFLKLLRKSFFKPLVGDRLSTFHFKTALLFTVETYPPQIWQEHNLLQCVTYCLKSLQRWFKLRYCPHYTISGVDLFVGKLKHWEFPPLSAVLSDMIDNITVFVSKIEIDRIGVRIDKGLIAVSTRHQNMLGTVMHCFCHYIFAIFNPKFVMNIYMVDLFEIRNNIKIVRDILPLSLIGVESMHAIKLLYQILASRSASIYLQCHQPIPPNIYRLYEASLDSDLTSNRLKLASMLYCSGQFERAELVLGNTEELLHADVWQWCPCTSRTNHEPEERFNQRLLDETELEVIKSHVACSIIFNSLEINCMPAFLVYEMHKTISPEDVKQKNPLEDFWIDLAIIDSIPFLYYMQYLTYRQLGHQGKRLEALQKLFNYVYFESRGRGHIDTAFHVLGHCYELENRFSSARACYIKSLQLFPYNNAARWHIIRLLQ